MDYTFYLAFVKHIEDIATEDPIENEMPKMYLKIENLIEFDTFATTHGPGTYVDGM